jgi:hypothetical protein
MTASQQRSQRGAKPSGVSLVSAGVLPGADGVVVRDTAIRDDPVHRRADELDAEAAYYRHRAIQEERALGPGYYVDLLRGMAAERAAMAQRIRTGNGTARDPARQRVPQSPSQVPVRSPQSSDRRTHRHVAHHRGR